VELAQIDRAVAAEEEAEISEPYPLEAFLVAGPSLLLLATEAEEEGAEKLVVPVLMAFGRSMVEVVA